MRPFQREREREGGRWGGREGEREGGRDGEVYTYICRVNMNKLPNYNACT